MSAEVLSQPVEDVSPRLKGFFTSLVGGGHLGGESLTLPAITSSSRTEEAFQLRGEASSSSWEWNRLLLFGSLCVTSDLADVTPEHQRSCALVSWRLLYTPVLHQSQSNLPFPETHRQADEHVLFSEHTLQRPLRRQTNRFCPRNDGQIQTTFYWSLWSAPPTHSQGLSQVCVFWHHVWCELELENEINCTAVMFKVLILG